MILDSFRLDGRAALITGASRGLGAAISVALAQAGADVALLDVEPCDSVREQIESLGRTARVLPCDLLEIDAERAAEIVADARAALGGLHILVNNAGTIRRAPALEIAEEDWRAVLDLNLNAVFLLCQAAGRCFVESTQGGKIVNIASMLSFQGGLYVPAYAASKSAVAGLTRALACEWAALNVNVNALAPGYFVTEVTAALRADPERSAAILSRIPAGRWGDPTDLQGAAVFLASDAARYLHGVILPVDGGWLAR